MQRLLYCFSFIFCALAFSSLGQTARAVEFYAAFPLSVAPCVDGILDDSAWNSLPAHNLYYDCADGLARSSQLKCSFQLGYTQRGIYVAVVNYENAMGELRSLAKYHDDPELLQDDRAEFFFDVDTVAAGYTKFIVNSDGVCGEMRKLYVGLVEENWDAFSWQAKSKRNDNNWTVEAFFPWEDLGGKGNAGQMWRFSHIRHKNSGAKTIFASSPGMTQKNPSSMGFLYFSSSGESLSFDAVAVLLQANAHPPWLFSRAGTFFCNLAGQLEKFSLPIKTEQMRSQLGQELLAIKMLAGDTAEFAAEASKYGGDNLSDCLGLLALHEKTAALKWKMMLVKKFEKK